MYKNRAPGGRNNLCGEKVKAFRERLPEKPSQREGVDLDKNAVQRLESGARFVTDIELKALAKVLHVSYEALLDDPR